MKHELEIIMAITMESPKHWWNHYEADGSHLAHSLNQCEIPFDEQIIPFEESDVFFDFHELEGTEIQTIHSFNRIPFRTFVEFMDESCIYVSGICDTMGILDGMGIIPAKSIESDSYRNSWLSMYVCPIYGNEIPSEPSFNRFFKLLEKYDGYNLMRMVDMKDRFDETETNQMEV